MCNCWKTPNFLFFLSGAAFWAAITHAQYYFSKAYPVTHWGMPLTETNNFYYLVGALVISVVLHIFAHRAKKGCDCDAMGCNCGKEECTCSQKFSQE